MPQPVTLVPVAVVRSSISAPVDNIWGDVRAKIEFDETRFGPQSLTGLSDFSHVEVIFLLDRVPEETVETGARHPRGRSDWPLTGIFAQRGRNRPNRIGATVCRLLNVENLTVTVEGLDAIDGTPVLDLKPYLREFGPRGEVRQPLWATELMSRYWSRK